MKADPSRLVLGIGFAFAAVAAIIGFDAQIYCQIAVGILAPIANVAGIKRRKPATRAPWIFIAAMIFGLNVATIVGTIDPLQLSNSGVFPNHGDVLTYVSYFLGICGVVAIGRARDDGKDPTHVIDAMIVGFAISLVAWTVLMLPQLADTGIATRMKISAATFTAIDLAWGAASIRVMMGPGAKRAPYWYVLAAISCGLVTDTIIGADAAGAAFYGQWTIDHFTPTAQYLFLAAAALHKQMPTVTTPASVEIGQLTRKRLALMTVAVLTPPFALASQLHQMNLALYAAWLVPLWAVISILVMARFAGLLRAREQHARDTSRARFESLVTHTTDVIAIMDGTGVLSYMSPSCEAVFEYPAARLIGRNVIRFAHPDDVVSMTEFLTTLDGAGTSPRREFRFTSKSGTWKTLDITITDLRNDPAVGGIVLNAHDVTGRKNMEEDLRHRATHDSLTGIANRVLFHERVAHALTTRDNGRLTAAMFIDLDDFKTINDGLGHAVGDELLKVVAARLTARLRDGDTAARLGGDEFAVLLEDVPTAEHAHNIAEKLISALREPIQFGDREIRVTSSIGIAVNKGTGDVEVLLRNADVAMYHAKWAGKGTSRLFDESMHRTALEQLDLLLDK